jgi:hypothetical protein
MDCIRGQKRAAQGKQHLPDHDHLACEPGPDVIRQDAIVVRELQTVVDL